jgi:hypothetical protein
MASFTQTVHDCAEHDNCAVIVGRRGRRVAWESHWSADVHPEHRLNIDYPDATDHRGRKPRAIGWSLACDECVQRLRWDEETRHEVAFRAHRAGRGTLEELAALARIEPGALARKAARLQWDKAN